MAENRISPEELYRWLEEKKGAMTVVDVRSKQNFTEGHVPGALHIPVGQMKQQVPDLPKTDLIVTY